MIAGCAWRTPLGGVEEAIGRVLAGERAPRHVGGILAARIEADPRESRHRRFLRRMELFAVEVGLEAAERAGVRGSERLGLFAGVGGLRPRWAELLPALAEQDEGGASSWARGLSRLHPFWMLQHLSNNAHALLAAELGARGEGACFGGATAGAQALAAAVRALDAGAIDAAVVVAHDALLEPEALLDARGRGVAGASGEAAAAVVLRRTGWARVEATCRADPAPLDSGEPRPAATVRLADQAARGARIVDHGGWMTTAFGSLGAATGVVQAIAWSTLLRLGRLPSGEPTRERAVVALSGGAPGLMAGVRVELA